MIQTLTELLDGKRNNFPKSLVNNIQACSDVFAAVNDELHSTKKQLSQKRQLIGTAALRVGPFQNGRPTTPENLLKRVDELAFFEEKRNRDEDTAPKVEDTEV